MLHAPRRSARRLASAAAAAATPRKPASSRLLVSFEENLNQGVVRSLSTVNKPPPDAEEHPPDASTLVQGPSLLTGTGMHRPSPSLFHLPGLRALPFWTAPPSPSDEGEKKRNRVAYNDRKISEIVETLEENYETILDEYKSAVLGMTTSSDPDKVQKPLEPDYDVNAKGGEHADDALHTGTWDWHSCILSGVNQPEFAIRCPKTYDFVHWLKRKGLLFETPFSFCFFSTLQGKSRIKAHTGPMNLRLRIHLPLIVPPTSSSSSSSDNAKRSKGKPRCGIRVGSQIREWEEGKALILDDSYEHEVWNDTEEPRVLFLVDVWHPDVTALERDRVRNMFNYAKEKGWIGK